MVYLDSGHLGARVLAYGPASSFGVHNGLRPGRTCHTHKPRHNETALGSSESDDVATKGTEAGDDLPRWQTSDPEIRADQEPCGAVGQTGGNDRSFRRDSA